MRDVERKLMMHGHDELDSEKCDSVIIEIEDGQDAAGVADWLLMNSDGMDKMLLMLE